MCQKPLQHMTLSINHLPWSFAGKQYVVQDHWCHDAFLHQQSSVFSKQHKEASLCVHSYSSAAQQVTVLALIEFPKQ